MSRKNWLIYGAYGYTGQQIAAEAVRSGHQPVLAGRSATPLQALADRLGLEYRVVRLEDPVGLAQALANVALVFHTAGPFRDTSLPMVQACLKTSTHYLDLTGEVPVCEQTFGLDAQARSQNIVLIPGAGYDAIPSDCLARCLADRLPDANQLDLAIETQLLGSMSAGSSLTAIEIATQGPMVRRAGQLCQLAGRPPRLRIQFVDHQRWGVLGTALDLSTAYRSTGIPNIQVYAGVSAAAVPLTRWATLLWRGLPRTHPFRRLTEALVRRSAHGPNENQRKAGKTYIWGRVTNPKGQEAQGWLITPEPYQFTAWAAVRAVEHILAGQAVGALSPAQAFGADFILQFPGLKYFDHLPG